MSQDYSQYQGPSAEWEAFLKQNPVPLTDLSIAPQTIREATNAARIQAAQYELEADGLLSRVTWRDHAILTRDKQNIIVRVYKPKSTLSTVPLPIYLYFHGGGHLFGSIETEDAACSRLAYRAGFVVVNVGYRHTPEFKHPTQVNDAWDSFQWLSRNISVIGGDPNQVVVGGISAGAGLAAFVAVQHHKSRLKEDPLSLCVTLCGQLLCVPWLVHPHNNRLQLSETTSYEQNISASILPRPLLDLFTDLLDAEDPKDPSLNTALLDDCELMGLPKTSFLIAGQDLLRDEGLFYASRLKNNNVATRVHVFPGLPHAFRRYFDLPSSRRWDELLVQSCKWFITDKSDSSFTIETPGDEAGKF